ncbi:MAG: universal stress protein [Chloroflexi bacterium]|nr:universal stress protein [Chloroflexota bacterium]
MDYEARVLLCVDGASASQLLASALPLVATPAHWRAVHVVDARGRMDLGALRHAIGGAGPLPPHQVEAIEEAGTQHANLVLDAATAAFNERGLLSEAGLVRVGEPGREICTAANAWPADLVVLRASRRSRPEPAPRSVGHTARFVLDHAPCPVLLIRS